MGSDEVTTSFCAIKRMRRITNSYLVSRRGRFSLVTLLLLILISTLALKNSLGQAWHGLRDIIRWPYHYFNCYAREAGIDWELAPVVDMSRVCPPVNYPTVAAAISEAEAAGAAAAAPKPPHPRICLTTLTDSQSGSVMQRTLRCRNFDNVAKLTFPNLKAYAERHGYTFVDYSAHIDTSRPPAWSKILAVQSLLDGDTCDWVFWIDADIVVMNSTIAVESFLPVNDRNHREDVESIDMLITFDRKFTGNSGAWLIRNTDWSKQFLQTWWNRRGMVRQPGLSLSGDNAAFGQNVQDGLQSGHIRMVPRCTFNSFVAFLPKGSQDITLEGQEWYLSENFYHKGDFMAHASGKDKKEACVEMLLTKAT